MGKMDPDPSEQWSGQTKKDQADKARSGGMPGDVQHVQRDEAGKGRRGNVTRSDEGGLNPSQKGPAQPPGTGDAV